MIKVGASVLEQVAEEAVRTDVYPSVLFPPSVYYRFLYCLTKRTGPGVCVELGLCGGGGSLHMALGCPTSRVIGIDVANQWPDRLEHVMERCPRFEFWQCDSIEAAEIFAQDGDPGSVDILFIDTVHTYERTMAEFQAWKPLLSDRALVVLDDLYRVGMGMAWDELPGYKVRLDAMHEGGSPTDGGFGVIYGVR